MSLNLGEWGGGYLRESIAYETGEDLWLVSSRRGTGDFALVASVRDEFDGEFEHEAVRVLVG